MAERAGRDLTGPIVDDARVADGPGPTAAGPAPGLGGLEAFQFEAIASEPPPEAQAVPLPRRRRGLPRRWLVPAAVLMAAAAAIVVRERLSDWRGLPLPSAPKTIDAAAAPATARAEPGPRPAMRVEGEPVGPVLPEARPIRPRPVALGAGRPRLPWDAAALAPGLGEDRGTAIARAEIEREARAKRTDRLQLAQLIALQPEVGEREAERGRALQIDRVRREAAAGRGAFHKDLAKILRESGDRAAPAIHELIESRLEPLHNDLARVATTALEARGPRTDRAAKAAAFRSAGLPEAAILREFARLEVRRIPARNGPKNVEEALVRAARQLLALKPDARPDPGRRAQGGRSAP